MVIISFHFLLQSSETVEYHDKALGLPRLDYIATQSQWKLHLMAL